MLCPIKGLLPCLESSQGAGYKLCFSYKGERRLDNSDNRLKSSLPREKTWKTWKNASVECFKQMHLQEGYPPEVVLSLEES